MPRVSGGATFDPTGRYRYRLWRRWGPGRLLTFILLNPNKADAVHDDPTIRRCIGFSRAWQHDGVEILNLFARCAPSPALLRRARDPVGPGNDRYLERASRRSGEVVVGWGNHGGLHGRDAEVLRLIGARATILCLGTTLQGRPRHPLYLRVDTLPVPFEPAPDSSGVSVDSASA